MGFDRRETHSFVAATALTRFAVVKPNGTANTVAYAAAGETENLWVTETSVASGRHVACRPLAAAGGSFKMQAAGAIAINTKVGITGAVGRVDDAGVGGIAVALEAASAAGEEFVCGPAYPGSALVSQAQGALGTTLTDSTTETALASKTINGASLSIGDVIEVQAYVDVPSTNSTDTLLLELMFGTEIIKASATLNVTDNDLYFIHALITVVTLGATGTVRGAGHETYGVIATAVAVPFVKDAATEDISGDVTVRVDGTWSVAHASNQCNMQSFLVTHHKA